MTTPQNFENARPDAVVLPFRRQLNDEELLALSVMFAYCEREDTDERPGAPEAVRESARIIREVLR